MPAAHAEIRVVLKGPLTVATCEAAHLKLSEALTRTQSIVIETEAMAEADLTFLQLLASARRSAESAGKSVALATPPAGPLAETIAACGFRPSPGATALKDILLAPIRREA